MPAPVRRCRQDRPPAFCRRKRCERPANVSRALERKVRSSTTSAMFLLPVCRPKHEWRLGIGVFPPRFLFLFLSIRSIRDERKIRDRFFFCFSPSLNLDLFGRQVPFTLPRRSVTETSICISVSKSSDFAIVGMKVSSSGPAFASRWTRWLQKDQPRCVAFLK